MIVTTGKTLFRKSDTMDKILDQNLRGRARIYCNIFDTTGKIRLRQIWRDGQDSLTIIGATGKIILQKNSHDGQDFLLRCTQFTLYPFWV